MSMYFSPSAPRPDGGSGAFYDDALKADYARAGSWPADAVAITEEVYTEFLGQPAAGKILGAVDIQPAWVDAPPLTLAQQAAVALVAGLTIALSGSIELDPTLFQTAPAAQRKMNAVIIVLAATNAFPGGAASFPIKDRSGIWHTLTMDQYKAVAGAIAAYVAALELIADGNPLGATELPPNTITLTV